MLVRSTVIALVDASMITGQHHVATCMMLGHKEGIRRERLRSLD